jgi:hypothetical protein
MKLSTGPVVLKLNGGTGAFKGAHGSVTSVNVGNNANLTVKLS